VLFTVCTMTSIVFSIDQKRCLTCMHGPEFTMHAVLFSFCSSIMYSIIQKNKVRKEQE